LRFADFELDRGASELRRGGRVVRLERKPLDLLFLLAERCGQLVARDEIVERILGKVVSQDGDLDASGPGTDFERPQSRRQ
jgi:DNA-binding winged helix-turn-helix (wHTH) protein